MITGVHTIIYSTAADDVRAFLRDVIGFSGRDIGGGWLVFALPPAELAVHPVEEKPSSVLLGQCELYLMCDDINTTLEELRSKGVEVSRPVSDEGWGLLTALRLPGGTELGLYEPRHPTALS